MLSICGTFWDQVHVWSSAKKPGKILGIMGACWEEKSTFSWTFITPVGIKIKDQNYTDYRTKKWGKFVKLQLRFEKKSSGLVYLWHLLGSKSHLVIEQKSGRIKITLLLLGTKMVGNAWYYTPVLTKKSITIGVGSKSHSLYSSKKLKKMLCGGKK